MGHELAVSVPKCRNGDRKIKFHFKFTLPLCQREEALTDEESDIILEMCGQEIERKCDPK